MKKVLGILALVALGGWAYSKSKTPAAPQGETEAEKQARLLREQKDAEDKKYKNDLFQIKQPEDFNSKFEFEESTRLYRELSASKGTWWQTSIAIYIPAKTEGRWIKRPDGFSVFETVIITPEFKLPIGTKFKAIKGIYKNNEAVVYTSDGINTFWVPINIWDVKSISAPTGGGSSTSLPTDSGGVTATGGGGGFGISRRPSLFFKY